MLRVFVALPSFWNDWVRLKLSDGDLADLEKILLIDPGAGDVLKETGGIRKVRFALPGGGKSSGVRVFYLDVPIGQVLYFLAVIAKNESENLSKAERNELLKLGKLLKENAIESIQKAQSGPRRGSGVRSRSQKI